MFVTVDVPAISIGFGAWAHVQTHEDLTIDVVCLDAIHWLPHDHDIKLTGYLAVALNGFFQLATVVVLKLTAVIL